MECAQINDISAVIERLAARTKIVSGTLESELHIPISPFDFAVSYAVARVVPPLTMHRSQPMMLSREHARAYGSFGTPSCP